jgi:hypothetical protein
VNDLSNQEIYYGKQHSENKHEILLEEIKKLKEELTKSDNGFNTHSQTRRDLPKDRFTKEEKEKKIPAKKETGLLPENNLFLEMLGEEILLTTRSDQLNILGQTFRPIFCGRVVEVTDGFITLDPVIIKMNNAPFHCFPTPLSFPMERIANFVPFNCDIQFPIP